MCVLWPGPADIWPGPADLWPGPADLWPTYGRAGGRARPPSQYAHITHDACMCPYMRHVCHAHTVVCLLLFSYPSDSLSVLAPRGAMHGWHVAWQGALMYSAERAREATAFVARRGCRRTERGVC